MEFIYGLVLLLLTIYSYCLLDPNLTFFNHHLWEVFRNQVIYLGYYERHLSWLIYIGLIGGLFFFNLFLTKKFRQYSPVRLALITVVILGLSYPFLSHDLFNYMFDAKIVTVYHQNPYFYKALDFPNDNWLRFMHWTHRFYPYGPTFLPISLIPSFFSGGKFFFSFIFFKLTFNLFYLLAVIYLKKISRKAALFFATSPLVVVEGLVNSHNDLIMTSLALMGFYFLWLKRKKFFGRVCLIFAAGIKYFTLPLIFVAPNKQSLFNLGVFLLQILFLAGLAFKIEVQPWYFLNLFTLLPYWEELIYNLGIFFFGLLLSYSPFILQGSFTQSGLDLKHLIICLGLIFNLIYLGVKYNKQICSLKLLKK